jgi:hypothetical protein
LVGKALGLDVGSGVSVCVAGGVLEGGSKLSVGATEAVAVHAARKREIRGK